MSETAGGIAARSASRVAAPNSLRHELILKRVLQWSVLGTALVAVVFPLYWMLLTAFDPPTLKVGS